MKQGAKIVIILLAAAVLAFTTFYFSLLLVWGRIVEVDWIPWIEGVILLGYLSFSEKDR